MDRELRRLNSTSRCVFCERDLCLHGLYLPSHWRVRRALCRLALKLPVMQKRYDHYYRRFA